MSTGESREIQKRGRPAVVARCTETGTRALVKCALAAKAPPETGDCIMKYLRR